MSRDSVQVVILSEDRQFECFVRRFLVQQGWDRRKIRTETLQKGKGSGEQWVRERFVIELEAYRSRSTRAATCLIVATDADTMTVQERINSIKSHCEDSQVAFRQDNERIAFVVPKRNIETWLEYLRGNDVDETTAYSKYANPGDCGPDVALLDEMCRQKKLRATPPPSLMSACAEFARL